MSKEKTIFLKSWIKPMAEEHARVYVEDVLEMDEKDPKYEKEFEKAFYKFCEEFYEDSVIPHAANPLKASNPTISPYEKIYENFKTEFISNLKHSNPELKIKKYSDISRGVSLIANALLESEMGKMLYDIKEVEGESKEEKTANRHERVVNRFKRYLFGTMIMGLIKSVFKLKKDEIDSLVKELYKDSKWRSLQTKKEIDDFINKVKKGVEADIKDYSPLDSIKKEFKK
jgi:hypothetical protein